MSELGVIATLVNALATGAIKGLLLAALVKYVWFRRP